MPDVTYRRSSLDNESILIVHNNPIRGRKTCIVLVPSHCWLRVSGYIAGELYLATKLKVCLFRGYENLQYGVVFIIRSRERVISDQPV